MRPATFTGDGALRCECANGERVTVLVEAGEPRIDDHAIDHTLHRIVRSDGTVILDDVVRTLLSGPAQRRVEFLRARYIRGYTARGEPIFGGLGGVDLDAAGILGAVARKTSGGPRP